MLKYRFGLLILSAAFPAALLAGTTPAIAQSGGSASIPSGQQPGARELKSALSRLGQNRNNVDALMDAGNAALLLDDADAALNFFRRAENLRPSDGRVKAGMGAAMVRLENPFDALQYFDAATRLGVNSRMIALDRGLAFDLIGNFDRAQQDYAIAGTALNSDALTIRHAISLSLSGKAKQSDNMLDPLLRRNNPAAWRARAFMLAARGDFRKSREVARGFLNVRAAQQVEPFLRRMPNLTAAQQAAAIHLGHFPTRNIGRDNPRIGVASAQIPAQGSLPGAVRVSGSDRLTPAGRPLGAPPTDVAQPVSVAQRMIAEAAVAARNVKPTAPAFKRPAASSVAVAAAPVRAVSPPAPLPSRITPKKILTTRNEPVAPPASAAVAAVPAIPVITKAAPSISAATPPAVSVSQMTPSAAVPVAPPVTPPVASSAVTTTSAGFDSLNSSARPPAASATTAVTPNAIPKAAAIPAPTTQPASRVPSASNVAAAAQIAKPGIIFKPSPGANSAQAQSGAARSAASVTAATSASAALPAAASPSASVQSSAGSFDLGDIVESINIPQSEKQRAVQPVDLAALPKQNVAPAAKPAAQAKPDDPVSAAARFWVQIATGPISAHSGEYRRLSRKYSEVFKGQQGWSSAWNNTGRLVVGPFDGFTAADEWYDALIKAGGDGFVWKSAKGTQVVPLKRK